MLRSTYLSRVSTSWKIFQAELGRHEAHLTEPKWGAMKILNFPTTFLYLALCARSCAFYFWGYIIQHDLITESYMIFITWD